MKTEQSTVKRSKHPCLKSTAGPYIL